MCYQLEQLFVYLRSKLLSLEEQYDSNHHNGYIGERIEVMEDIIEKVEEMLATSKCKGNHLG